jgi:5,10-methylenetetrahydromethanopterin reductase
MRAAWTGAEVRYEGETMRFRGKMRFPLLRWGIPIVIGARGRSLLELAGETADGVMISTFVDPRAIRYALSHVEAGAARAGRSMDDLRVLCRLDCCIDRDSQEAREAVKPMLVASLKSSYPNWQFLEPLGLTVPEAVREAIVSGERDRIAATAPLLPDTFAEALALCGTSKEVAGQVRRIVELGIGEIAINPIPLPGQRVEEQIEAFQEVAGRSAAVPGGAG